MKLATKISHWIHKPIHCLIGTHSIAFSARPVINRIRCHIHAIQLGVTARLFSAVVLWPLIVSVFVLVRLILVTLTKHCLVCLDHVITILLLIVRSCQYSVEVKLGLVVSVCRLALAADATTTTGADGAAVAVVRVFHEMGVLQIRGKTARVSCPLWLCRYSGCLLLLLLVW